jgi:hypothetical protein
MRSIAIFLTFYVNVCIGCSNVPKDETISNRQAENKYVQMIYKETIDTIDKKVVDLTAASDLFGIDEFISIYEASMKYKDEALLFISDSINSAQKKQITVYSMQSLPDSLYIDFCSSVVSLYEKGNVADELAETAVFYSINKKYQIIRNYKNPKVISLLENLKAFSKRNEIKERIDNILSGKAWDKLADFLDNGN